MYRSRELIYVLTLFVASQVLVACGRSDLASHSDAPVLTIIDSGVRPFAIIADDSALYWGDYETGEVHRTAYDGNVPAVLRGAAPGSNVYGLALLGDELFVCNSGTGSIELIPRLGGPSVLVASSPCHDLLVDGTQLFWTNGHTEGLPAIRAMDRPPRGIARDLSVEKARSTKAKVHGDWIYYTDHDGGLVARIPVAGGTSEVIATTEPAGPWGIAVDDVYVYYADHHPGHGSISRVPHAGGAPEILVADLNGAHDLLLDGDVLYWTERLGGRVGKVTADGEVVVLFSGLELPSNLASTRDAIYLTMAKQLVRFAK